MSADAIRTRRWREENPERARNQRRKDGKIQAGKVRRLLDRLKAGACMDCGAHFPPECMDFDHVRGEKRLRVNTQGACHSMARVMAEIEKCDLVCENCHRTRTRARKLRGGL